MRLVAFVLLILAMSFGMFCFGVQTPLSQFMIVQNGAPSNWAGIVVSLLNNMLNTGTIGLVAAAAIGVGIITGFSGVYVIPAMILVAMANVILLPLSFFNAGVCQPGTGTCIPDPISLSWYLLLNVLLYATVWEFIRGGG